MPEFSRKNMPQVDTQNLSKAMDMVSDKAKITKGTISAGKLKKSQKELHQDKVEGIAARFTSPDKFKPLIISKDNHIVDGHHRWGAAIYKWGKDVKIPIIRINLPIMKAIALYKDVADSLNEAITIPIEIGDTVLGGKFKNKRIVVKSIDKNEKGDITINGKPLMKFRLVNEQIGYGIGCKNCNHSWDIEPNDDRPYLCHNCGYDSQMQKIDMVGFKDWKKTLKENVAPNHNGKSAPYGSGYDEMDEANAVSGGKVHKLITGKNLTFKGKKYSDIEFEVLGIDNNSQIVKLKILAPKNLFGEELNVPFKTIRRGPFLKTDTSKQFEGTISEIGDGSANSFKWQDKSNVSQKMKKLYQDSEYMYHSNRHPLVQGVFHYNFNSDDGTKYIAGFDGFIKKLPPEFTFRPRPFDGYESEFNVFYNLHDHYYAGREVTTNKGNVLRVMSTMNEIINDFLVQAEKSGYPVKSLHISAKADGGKEHTLDSKRGRLYMAFIKKQLSNLKTKNKYSIDKKGDYGLYLKLAGVSEGIVTQPESSINEIPMGDLEKIDTFADKQLNPLDIVLTGRHFFDRLNDPRNGKEISNAELIGFFKRLSKKKKEFVEFLQNYNTLVATDDKTNINIPFMKQSNKAIAKTVMRKKDFKTADKKLDI
jgi:hypothetical protein